MKTLILFLVFLLTSGAVQAFEITCAKTPDEAISILQRADDNPCRRDGFTRSNERICLHGFAILHTINALVIDLPHGVHMYTNGQFVDPAAIGTGKATLRSFGPESGRNRYTFFNGPATNSLDNKIEEKTVRIGINAQSRFEEGASYEHVCLIAQ